MMNRAMENLPRPAIGVSQARKMLTQVDRQALALAQENLPCLCS